MTASVAGRLAAAAPAATSGTLATMLALMRYKQWADADLLRATRALPVLATAPEGGYMTAIIRHYHTVDCIFRAHLLGIPHAYSSSNPAEPATLSELEPRLSAVDGWYVEYAAHLTERELAEALLVTFTDGQQQVLTRSEILLYVSLHGAGHRGQVSLLLRKCGAEPPPDRLITYLRERSSELEEAGPGGPASSVADAG